MNDDLDGLSITSLQLEVAANASLIEVIWLQKNPYGFGIYPSPLPLPHRLSCMASTLSLILDNTSKDFTYVGPQDWTIDERPYWYGGSSTSPEFASAQVFGSFEIAFEGTSHSLIPFEQFQ